jgi:hypothetical protein
MNAKLLFDDGAGDTKAALAQDGEVGAILTFPSLVYEKPLYFETWDTHPQTMKVTNGQGWDYLVGDVVRDTIKTAEYDTAHSRYTNSDAAMRFFAACGRLLPAGKHDMQLVVGANVSAYQQQHTAIRSFYQQRHRFRFNDADYDIHVENCTVTSQPRGAWAALKVYPPLHLVERLIARPLDNATAILIDIGNLTTDVVVMQRGSEVNRFALTLGVQELRNRVAAIAAEAANETEIPLADGDHALQTRLAIDATGRDVDLSKHIDRSAKHIWQRAYKTIKTRLDGVKPHYIFVVGGGASDIMYGKHIKETWGSLPGFGIPDDPATMVLRGYGLLG